MSDWAIDHVAIVVGNLESAIDFYTHKLGLEQVYRETIAEQGVEAVGIRIGDAVLELLRPLAEDSPIARYRGSADSKLHHVAYQVPDIVAELARLKDAGIGLIDETPRRGAHGNRVAFLSPKTTGGVLTELCQRDTNVPPA